MTEIRRITNSSSVPIYPQTHKKAVLVGGKDDEGNPRTLDLELGGINTNLEDVRQRLLSLEEKAFPYTLSFLAKTTNSLTASPGAFEFTNQSSITGEFSFKINFKDIDYTPNNSDKDKDAIEKLGVSSVLITEKNKTDLGESLTLIKLDHWENTFDPQDWWKENVSTVNFQLKPSIYFSKEYSLKVILKSGKVLTDNLTLMQLAKSYAGVISYDEIPTDNSGIISKIINAGNGNYHTVLNTSFGTTTYNYTITGTSKAWWAAIPEDSKYSKPSITMSNNNMPYTIVEMGTELYKGISYKLYRNDAGLLSSGTKLSINFKY